VQHAVGIALPLPGVVDIDVNIAGIFHAGGDDLVGGVADIFVGDLACEVVPAVPAHRGRLGHLLSVGAGRSDEEGGGRKGSEEQGGKAWTNWHNSSGKNDFRRE